MDFNNKNKLEWLLMPFFFYIKQTNYVKYDKIVVQQFFNKISIDFERGHHMSKILRKFERELEKYRTLILYYPETAKENKKELLQDIELLIQGTQDLIKSQTTELELWGEINLQVFDLPDKNIFQIARKKFWMKFVNYHLYTISGKLERARLVEQNFKSIKTRFNQYVNLLH